MTIEARVPLDQVKSALSNYSRLYNTITNATNAFTYKKKMARYTLLSLLFTVVKIFLLFYCPTVLKNTDNSFIKLFAIVVLIFCIVTLFFDFFYLQKIADNGKTKRKLRFRPLYFIKGLICDVIEIEFFKKKFGLKAPAFLLIFGMGNRAAYSKITDWAIGVADAQVFAINNYEDKYKNYRDYVDLWQHFSLCGELLEIINSGRAIGVQEALDVVDVRRHRQRMENMRRQEMEAVKSAMRKVSDAASEVSAAARDIAGEVKETERVRREYYQGR